MSKKKFGGIIVGTLLIGMTIGAWNAPKPEQLDHEVDQLKAENMRLSEKSQNFAKLKAIDDIGFEYCAEAMGTFNRGVQAAFNRDADGMFLVADELNKTSEKISTQSMERELVLKELGY